MADGPLHFAGRRAEVPGNAGVEFLGDAVDHIRLVHHHFDGLTQELVAFDMGGNANGEEQAAQPLVQRLHPVCLSRSGCGIRRSDPSAGQIADVAHQMAHIEGLDHVEGRSQLNSPGDEIIPSQRGHHNGLGFGRKFPAAHFFQQRVAIHLRHDDVGDHDLKRFFAQQFEGFCAVSGLPYQRDALLPAQVLRHRCA